MTKNSTAMKKVSDMTAEEIARIDKLIMDTPIPRLGVNSVEDVDDLYQAKLEWRWEQDDREHEIEQLKSEKESINKRLQ